MISWFGKRLLTMAVCCALTSCQLDNEGIIKQTTQESIYFHYEQPVYPRDCEEVFDQCSESNVSGVYLIKPDGYYEPFAVYCESDTHAGQWTVFHRRQGGSISFQRNWTEYSSGFGFLHNEFWLGLEKLSYLTNQKEYQLRIEIRNADGMPFYLNYNVFRISDSLSNFSLSSLGDYSGSGSPSITWCPNNMLYGECTCAKTCEDPDGRNGCHRELCEDLKMCFCPDGFYMTEGRCVPPEECSCFEAIEGVIPNEGFHYNADCSRRCACDGGVVTCEDNFRCDVNAVCQERNKLRRCYCLEHFVGDGVTCTGPVTDCQDIVNAGYNTSGIYTISPTDWPGSPFEVYCNVTEDSGWTVFQRRVDGSVNFYQNWTTYMNGFGSPDNEIWLGNEQLFYMTKQKNYQLRVDIILNNGSFYYLEYDLFRVGDASSKFQLTLGSFSGNTDFDYMDFHRDQRFTTFDQDNDSHGNGNCAVNSHAGWW
ncbi:Ficolin-1 [Holothuria leucospilota]|uniref:Ficolin-1 n=1 Tax=Holothuria leucospilota TaxID=206669 RepID=A0A9Q1BUL4_HOLLE|nr:Ficolin-1 [Holothuria leucospilota]